MKFNFKGRREKGITLIALVITIIVLLILAGVTIATLTGDNGILKKAGDAKTQTEQAKEDENLKIAIAGSYGTDGKLNLKDLKDNLKNQGILTNSNEFPLEVTVNGEKKKIDANGNVTVKLESVADSKTKGTVFNDVTTLEDTYGNQVKVPKGFKIASDSATEVTGGIVIEDATYTNTIGSQFVWIPATESTYVKDTSFPGRIPTVDDTLPNGITDETADVKKYGGFYIGRYEAGVPENQTTIDGNSPSTSNVEGIPVSKKGATVWGSIDYTNAKASAEKMINNEYVQTGLLTGKAWDTTCHWIEDSLSSINASASLTDSRYYGNFKNSESPANVAGYGKKQVAGYSDKWMVKNIYDLAGNAWEWTSEAYSSKFIFRGGCFYDGGSDGPVSYRNGSNASITVSNLGFRVRLYIK